VSTGSRCLVDQLHAALAQLGKRRVEVLHAQGDVVQAGPAPVNEPRDRRLGRRRLEQLESRLPHRDEHRAHALGWHVVRRRHLEAQRIAIERQRFVQAADSDADVIERRLHAPHTLSSRSATAV
jgi:hypothetical protein